MMRPLLTLLALTCTVGCVGEAEYQPGSAPREPEPTDPSQPVQVGTFEGLSEGLPAGHLGGTAQFDGALYAVASEGLYRLPSGSKQWQAVALGAKATSVTRIDTALWVTASDGARLYKQALGDDDFSPVTTAPAAAAFALLKKGSQLLLATQTGLMASSDRGATWVSKTVAAPFDGPVVLVASPAATRVFALAGSVLWHSDDTGATWSSGLVGGEVTAISAEAEFALVQTSNGALRSDNYGNTFRPLDLGAKAQSFAASGSRAFAGTMTGMRVSDDSGLTWRDASNGLPAGTPVMQLFLAGGSLVASTGQAVYVATVK
ncbi:MAG: hypothetical protein JNK82_17180 [Myxococcaceae bacterium]|nr:hypothetical protein [Myxococcaceae bacterium]